ncbi:MAG: hypothetical protein R2705_18565 [Ilumatobacteraceae bacterium]
MPSSAQPTPALGAADALPLGAADTVPVVEEGGRVVVLQQVRDESRLRGAPATRPADVPLAERARNLPRAGPGSSLSGTMSQPKTANELRQAFTGFFQERGHSVVRPPA